MQKAILQNQPISWTPPSPLSADKIYMTSPPQALIKAENEAPIFSYCSSSRAAVWLRMGRARLSGPGLGFLVRTRTLRIRSVRSTQNGQENHNKVRNIVIFERDGRHVVTESPLPTSASSSSSVRPISRRSCQPCFSYSILI